MWLARAGLFAPLFGPRLLRNLPATRKRAYGMGYQDIGKLPLPVVRSYLEPVVGTKDLARRYQRWIASLHNRDLAFVEPALRRLTVPTLIAWGTGDIFFRPRYAHWLRDTIPGATEVVTIDGGRLFFPDERAADLVPHLRAHRAAHAAVQPEARAAASACLQARHGGRRAAPASA